ncbi:MAG: asparagine synthase (glutamine-hydrolyzing) [Gemmatimonadetes bacterium]|nr:asparagine synthase (glutamine-hydrolyzing) [Gemmatimonadota bacterium]
MCGLAGVVRRLPNGVSAELLQRMAEAIRHRGPDGSGQFADEWVGLAHVRLAVLDRLGGAQPMMSHDGRLAIVYNGEVFNFPALRAELSTHGHVFRTHSDTEVLLHAYEQWGERMLDRLNGQFAFALYDRHDRTVFLARDRFGILPLYYAERDGDLYFASEIKALLASGAIEAALDPAGLDQVLTFWAARPPRTPFRGVRAIEPGCCARWREGRLTLRRWYTIDFPEAAMEPADARPRLDQLLWSGISLRLLADIPVGGYLSGGLDSSAVCAVASEASSEALRTFSVTFDDPQYDESAFQQSVAAELGSHHAVCRVTPGDIARVFPDVIRHAETPLLRTAPAPLYLLSRQAREHGITVVLTGEGADEIFFGYELFKDTAVRLFCLRQPRSARRPRLFDRLYPYVGPSAGRGDFWRGYFLSGGSPDDPLFSHLPRFRVTAWVKDFLSDDFRACLRDRDPLAELRDELPPAFGRWSPLARAAYLEIVTLLSPYLLASQGDRMAMAHGVETRVPYLDHRLVEFAARLPAQTKLRGLRDKRILRRWAADVLPRSAAARAKQPYRAPDVPAFFTSRPPEYVAELLEPASLKRTGVFDPRAVAGLLRRCRAGLATGARESQAMVAILSTELWQHEFLRASSRRRPEMTRPPATPVAALS